MSILETPADLRALTTLRFFAAAWVVLYTAWPHLDVGFVPNAVAKGYLGVETFFVLSGFILSHVYLEAFGQKRYDGKSFLWARIARVYPMHLLTLAGMAALGVAAGFAGIAVDASLTDWRALPAQLTMTHAWGLAPSAAFNHPSWSISAEWFAYLTFPAYAFAAWKLRDRPWIAVGLAVILALALYAAFQPLAGFPLTEATFRWGALRIVPCFALGCALYLVRRRGPVPHAGWIAAAAALGMALSASLLWWDAVTVLFAGVLILALGSLENARAGLLASSAGVYLGEISYSIYMLCAPVILVMTNLAAVALGADSDRLHVIVWLAVIAAIPVAAAIAYHLVERPARQALRRVAVHKAPLRDAAQART